MVRDRVLLFRPSDVSCNTGAGERWGVRGWGVRGWRVRGWRVRGGV